MAWIRTSALAATAGATLLALVACSHGRAEVTGEGAKSLAVQFMKAADPNAQYRPLCTTELKDGYIITLRRTPIGPPGNIEHADVSPFAVVTVSRAARLQLARRTPVANDTEASDKSVGPSGVLDSAAAIAAAQRVVPARQTLHCLIRLSGGAWVEFLRDDASAAKDRVGGAVVAVESATNARIIATF